MATIASKVLGELRKQSKRDVVDLGAFREARAEVESLDDEFGGLSELYEDCPVGHRYWMDCYSGLARLGFSLLGSRHLVKLAERVDESKEAYMPGGPPMSPLTDSFHSFWCLADTSVGLKKETLATVAIVVGRSLGAPAELLSAWKMIAESYAGVYRIVAREQNLVTLVELVTGDERVVELADDVPGVLGEIWWTRLLPPEHAQVDYWTSIVTPYRFPMPDAEQLWVDYFERQLAKVPAAKRAQAYRRHMNQGASPMYWFDFIFEAYSGVADLAVNLSGVPDRPHTLPHSEDNEAASEAMSPLERVRAKLFVLARELGLDERAEDDFFYAREELAGLHCAPPKEWSQALQGLLWAFTMFECPEEAEQSAMEVLANAPTALDEEEAASLAMLKEGWFSLFEVLRIKVDEAIEVRDVIRRKRFWITERSATRGLSLGDCLGAWIMKDGDKSYLEGALARVPRVWAKPVIESLQAVIKDLRKERSMSWRQRQGQLAPALCATLALIETKRPPVDLVNQHGEAILLSEALYKVSEPKRVLDLLRAEEKLEESGPDCLVWIDKDKDVIVGEFEVCDDQLRVHGNSVERLAMLRAWVEETLGELVEYRLTTHEDPTSSAQENRPPKEINAESMPPEVFDMLSQTLQKQLASWLDEEIPALGNKTPRQAVRSAKGRDKVTSLLMDQERVFKDDPVMGRVDLSFLWSELGLEHPDQRA